jgi:hypothetical protein
MWISERFAEPGFNPNADPDNMSLVHPYLKVLSSCIRPLDESEDPKNRAFLWTFVPRDFRIQG